MNSQHGRTIRLFLINGTVNSLITAEIMNWTGHVLVGSRSDLPAFVKRSELDRTGIYFLIGPDPQDRGASRLYIGESDNVRKRLDSHNRDRSKDFWERTVVVTSKDQNITKAHARWLEARLIKIANDAGMAKVDNNTDPPLPSLPEADESDMGFFVGQLLLILPVLGFDFLRQTRVTEKIAPDIKQITGETPPAPHFRPSRKKNDINARAQHIDNEFVVIKGSTAIKWKGRDDSDAKRQGLLIGSGKLVPQDNHYLCFTENVAFSSPSAAAACVLGRPANGRTSWIVEGTDVTYGQWHEEQVAKSATEL